MNSLDDLMDVWRSQDAGPIQGVDETLLRLALRQDQARIVASRGRERLHVFLIGTSLIGIMAFFFIAMIYNKHPKSAWEFSIPIAGAVAAAFWMGALYISHRAQTAREHRFDESLREQILRRIAQLDYQASRSVRAASVLAIYLPPLIVAAAVTLAAWRINNEPFNLDFTQIIVWVILGVAYVLPVWQARRSVQFEILPRRRRLESLLSDLDGQ